MSERYLLDTNICIYIARRNPPEVRERALSSIETLAQLITLAPLPEAAAEHYGEIRAELQKSGQMIGNNDLWIAAHARAQGWIIVTNNERVFILVAGLQVENWVR